MRSSFLAAALGALAATVAVAQPEPADRLLTSLTEPGLNRLAVEVLARNPKIAAARERVRAAERSAGGAGALPDPTAALTAFLAPPETRVGPQRLSVGISQGLPWPGKRDLARRAEAFTALALARDLEAERLKLLTEVRRLVYELAYLDRVRTIEEVFRRHLVQHEEISRARYATGVGISQGVIKLQAEITRADAMLLANDEARGTVAARINALRDRPSGTPLPRASLPDLVPVEVAAARLLEAALDRRPELAAADARIGRAEAHLRLAEKGYRPDLQVGLSYTVVEPREDAAGRAMPPAGNGDDIVALQGAVKLPVWRRKLAEGVAEAAAMRRAAWEERRRKVAEIEGEIGIAAARLPPTWSRLRLMEDQLLVQAGESLESAKAGYVAGTLGALDLLDAEHVLFDAQTATERARVDYLIARARLEGEVGGPLGRAGTGEGDQP